MLREFLEQEASASLALLLATVAALIARSGAGGWRSGLRSAARRRRRPGGRTRRRGDPDRRVLRRSAVGVGVPRAGAPPGAVHALVAGVRRRGDAVRDG